MGRQGRQARLLEEQLTELLQGSLGLNIYPGLADLARLPGLGGLAALARRPRLADRTRRFAIREEPIHAGLQMVAVYFFFFGILPWFVFWLRGAVPPSLWPLFVLQFYGALWAGWATTSTRIVSRSVMDVIAKDVLPELSPTSLAGIREALDRRYTPRWRLLVVSWGLGAAAAALAGYLVYHDLPGSLRPSLGEIVWWCLGWTLLYTTSAKVVNVGRFYDLLAGAVAAKPARFWPNAAGSVELATMALVTRRMLLFWSAIAVSIALILPFAAVVAETIRVEPRLGGMIGSSDWAP